MRDVVRLISLWRPDRVSRVFRVVQGSSEHPVTRGTAGAEKYRQVFQSTLKDFRWTGPRPATPRDLPADIARLVRSGPAAGGLYVACSLNDAALGEFTTYATAGPRQTTFDRDALRTALGRQPWLDTGTFQIKLAGTHVFEYAVPPGLLFVDLSLGTGAGRALLDALLTDVAGANGKPDDAQKQRVDDLNRALRGKTPRDAYVDPNDYSFCRAMGQAVRDLMPRSRGLRVTSVRSDAGVTFSEYSGDNLVLFAPDGHVITDLTPVQELSFAPQPTGPMRTVKKPL